MPLIDLKLLMLARAFFEGDSGLADGLKALGVSF